jgi:chemotaxis protein methyltransferase CheR
MRITDFDVYKDLLREKSGLNLSPEKSSLLESRLSPIAKKWGYASMEIMAVALQGVPDKKLINLINDVVEAMTTNDTSFMRDVTPFTLMRDTMLPYFISKRARQKKIHIWSAACASGQEPYSIAITLKDKGLPPSWKVEITATDISRDSIDRAKMGVFSQFEVQRGLSIHTLLKHFTQDEDKWILHNDISKMVKFDYFNLLDDMKKMGKFDIIFCRNVLLLFDEKMRKTVLGKLTQHLEPDGFLVLGKSENTIGLSEDLKPIQGSSGVHAFRDSLHHVN